jgi:hypothetical protein
MGVALFFRVRQKAAQEHRFVGIGGDSSFARRPL